MLSEISVSLPGTETDFFARYRAFPCLESHYRTYLFRECRACGLLEAADISNASEVKMCITKGDLMSKLLIQNGPFFIMTLSTSIKLRYLS